MLQEEQDALKSMFCFPGECSVQGTDITLNLSLRSASDEKEVVVQTVLQLPKDYPNSSPHVSIFTDCLSREMITDAKQKASDYCLNILGEPMLVSLASYLQEYLQELYGSIQTPSKSVASKEKFRDSACIGDCIWTCILQIDHMRSKNKYCKTLEKWTAELMLGGRLLFYNKLIFVILQGNLSNIKDFIIRLKTFSIDVDSRGHSCKERMMKVLCEEQNTEFQNGTPVKSFSDFQITELADLNELTGVFIQASLEPLYHKYIKHLH